MNAQTLFEQIFRLCSVALLLSLPGAGKAQAQQSQHALLLLPIDLIDTKGAPLGDAKNVIIPWKQNADDKNPAAIAWIEPHGASNGVDPAMPWLVFKVGGSASMNLKIRWKLIVQYTRPNGSSVNDGTVQIPSSQSSQDGWATETLNGAVNIYANTDWVSAVAQGYFGGKAQLTYQLLKADNTALTSQQPIFFDIGGKKLDGSIAKTYIDQQAQSADIRLVPLSYAVARHESKDYNGEGSRYNQFWEGYGHRFNADHRKGDPLWCKSPSEKSAGGFGMFQITGDLTSQFSNIPREQMWNWERNTSAYITFVKTGGSVSKGSVMDRFFASVARTYPADQEAQAPPTSYTYDGGNYDAWSMGTITLYNGASGCPVSHLKNTAGKLTSLTNPWTYDTSKPSGHRWQYHQNSNKYLHEVILQK